jgi:hypothetical protein
MLPGKEPAKSPSIPSAAYSQKESTSTPIQDFARRPTFKYVYDIPPIFTVSSASMNAISHAHGQLERRTTMNGEKPSSPNLRSNN